MIRTHAPDGYVCPFCELAAGDTSGPGNRCAVSDVVYQDADLLVMMGIDTTGHHPGHVMVCPAEHHENLYSLPDRTLQRIALACRQVARAMVAVWAPDGVSLRQHNEPAGHQHVWHYHQHVNPRFEADRYGSAGRRPVPVLERARLARELRAALDMSHV
ncbi:HIT family protein [Micrococcus luteus]|nr:HIT family protein [Micrococcus luteus]QZY83665.1 HIT family protein [Micrococcus luteus]